MTDHLLSPVEHLLLAAVVLLGTDAYGITIFEKAQELARPHGVKVKYGSIYPTLDRMERAGWLTSHLSDPIRERGGRSKRHYQIKALGEQLLKHSSALHNDLGMQLKASWGIA